MKKTDSNTYYYNQLTKPQQKAYYAIKSGLETMAQSFFVPRLDGKELADLYFKVRLDCPELFYSVNFKYRYYPDSENVEMIPEYLFQKNKLEEHKKAMEARVKKLVRQAENLNEKEKELFIHDFICENVRYDKLKKAYSHEIIGPLGQGVGVCEGIAKTVKILMDALGIWCIIAISEANPEKSIKYRHAWNVIRLGNSYYHLDATQTVKKKNPFLFHWRGSYMTREVMKEFLQIFEEESAKKEKYAYVSLNWQQAVILVLFEDQKRQQQVLVEEANEGERIESNIE